MPAPIYVDFVTRGLPEFSRALKTVSDAVARSEGAHTRLGVTGARVRTTAAEREARDKIRAMQKADQAHSRALSHGLREAEKVARAEAMAVERGARDRVRAMQRADDAVKRIRDQSVRDTERAEAQKNASAAKWVRQRERESATTRQRMVNAVGGAAASGFRTGLGRAAQATQQVAGTVLGLGGGFSVADSVQRSSHSAGMAADIANSGWMPNTKPGDALYANNQKRSSKSILGAARASAISSGTSTDDVLGGLQEFVGKSGDLDTGLKVMNDLNVLARATGANFKDVAGAAGDLMSQLGDMPNKSEAVLAIMRGIAGQGKLGAVEMRNMASQMAKLASAAGQFGGDAVDNILKMGMLAQESRASGGASSATMAATSVQGFTNTLKTPARIAQFKELGIDIFDKDKMLNSPTEIIHQSLAKTGGDPEKLKKLFANVMGERAVTGYANAYRKAEASQKGSGRGVVQGMFNKHLSGATMSKEEVAKAFADRMQESDAQFASMREKFDEAVERQLIPELLKLVPVLEKMIPVFIDLQAKALPAFVDLIKTFTEFAEANKGIISSIAAHPIGAIMAAEVSKSIGSAALGEVFKRLLTSAMGGGGGGGLGGAGKLGQAGAVAGAGLAAGYLTKEALDYGYGEADKSAAGRRSRQMEAHALTLKAGREGLTDAERARAAELGGQMKGDIAGIHDDNNGIAKSLGGAFGAVFSPTDTAEALKVEKREEARAVSMTQDTMAKLAAALDRNTAATNANSGAAKGGDGNPAKTPAQSGNMLAVNPFAGR